MPARQIVCRRCGVDVVLEDEGHQALRVHCFECSPSIPTDTAENERRMIAVLARAQRGDHAARCEVVGYVFDRWLGRVARFYHEDPALGKDDIQSDFYEGIWHGVDRADERGNPLYHLGQRGVWHVQSTIRATRRARHGGETQGYSMVSLEGGEEGMQVASDEDLCEVIVSSGSARQRVLRVIAHAQLGDTPRRLLALMLEHDPTEKGFNQRAGQMLGVSAQRASQAMAEIRREFEIIDWDGGAQCQ